MKKVVQANADWLKSKNRTNTWTMHTDQTNHKVSDSIFGGFFVYFYENLFKRELALARNICKRHVFISNR